jgi:P pilus assembly chaperone PapD
MRTLLLSALGLVTLVGSASAQPLPTELWAGGVIVKVDTTARTLDVRQGDHQQTYVIAADAEVKDGKSAAPLANLTGGIGQQVRLKYTAAGDTRTATRVTLLGVPKAGSAAAISAAAIKAAQPATTPE